MTSLSSSIIVQIKGTVPENSLNQANVYWNSHVFSKGETVRFGHGDYTMPYDGTIAFVDLAPTYNWAHPCLYLVIDADLERIITIESSLPPNFDSFPGDFTIIMRNGKGVGRTKEK